MPRPKLPSPTREARPVRKEPATQIERRDP